MSLFDSLGQQKRQMPAQGTNPLQMLQELKRNPVGMIKQAGYNVPAGVNDPGQILQYLLQSGQINNQKLQMAQQLAGMFRR